METACCRNDDSTGKGLILELHGQQMASLGHPKHQGHAKWQYIHSENQNLNNAQ